MGRDLLALATDNVLARHVLGEVHLCSPDVSDSACITLPQPIDHFWSIAGNGKEIIVARICKNVSFKAQKRKLAAFVSPVS